MTAERRFATIVVWNVADNHFVEPVTASMQRVRALGSQFKLNSRVVSWVIKSQPEGVGRTNALAGPFVETLKGWAKDSVRSRHGRGKSGNLQAIKSVVTM